MFYIKTLRRRLIYTLVSIGLCLHTTGCATSGKSILLGAGIGGATGAAIGGQRGNEATGAATGMIIGGLLGYFGHKNKKPKATKVVDKTKKDLHPFITRPVVRRYTPKPKIEGNRYIRNCEIFEIKENAHWRR